MPNSNQDEQESGLPPPGSRWGSGAQSVLPYLTRSLQSKPAAGAEQAREGQPQRDGHPVFAQRPSSRSA